MAQGTVTTNPIPPTQAEDTSETTESGALKEASVAPQVATSKTQSTPQAGAGKTNVFLISGSLSHVSQSLKVGSSSTETDSSVFSSAYDLKYLKNVGDKFWIGPIVGITSETTESEGSELNSFSISPGLEMRTMIVTKGNAYLTLGANAGWAIASESAESGGDSVSASYSGFYKSAFVGLGNRVGEEDTYLVETLIGLVHVPLSGTYESTKIKNSYTKFYMALSIGHLF